MDNQAMEPNDRDWPLGAMLGLIGYKLAWLGRHDDPQVREAGKVLREDVERAKAALADVLATTPAPSQASAEAAPRGGGEVLARGWYHWNDEEQDYELFDNKDAACETCIPVLIVRDTAPPAAQASDTGREAWRPQVADLPGQWRKSRVAPMNEQADRERDDLAMNNWCSGVAKGWADAADALEAHMESGALHPGNDFNYGYDAGYKAGRAFTHTPASEDSAGKDAERYRYLRLRRLDWIARNTSDEPMLHMPCDVAMGSDSDVDAYIDQHIAALDAARERAQASTEGRGG